jgi:hypothetical protein
MIEGFPQLSDAPYRPVHGHPNLLAGNPNSAAIGVILGDVV